MCAVCASFVPVAGSTVHGLLALGAVAGGAAVGSLSGFVRRPAPERTEQAERAGQAGQADPDGAPTGGPDAADRPSAR